MNKIIAIGLACCLPVALAAEDAAQSDSFLGTVNVLVMEDSTPLTTDVHCTYAAARAECNAFNRAVLTARTQKVSTLRERGRWM